MAMAARQEGRDICFKAFVSHTEQVLVAKVGDLQLHRQAVMDAMEGSEAPAGIGGDGADIVRPLPRIASCYIFYDADEDFPASATCLFSANANLFMPLDGLADVGEYTSRAMLKMVR